MERRESDRRRLLHREGGRRTNDTPVAPTIEVIVAELRLWATAARRQELTRTSNLALLAAARLEEFEAQRLVRHARSVTAAHARSDKLGPERRREIAMQAHATKRKKSYQVAS